MVEKQARFTTGEWLLHCYFGAGQVMGTETKHVSGGDKAYYKIETSNSILWLPVVGLDESKIRPISTPEEFEEAINELRHVPEEMDPNAPERKKKIEDVKAANIPAETARLVRDLWERQWSERGLYDWEREAWRFLSSRLVQEWTLCVGISAVEARQRLIQLLRQRGLGDQMEEELKPATAGRTLLDALADEDGKWSGWLSKAVNQSGEPIEH
jgi:RNA polymerase-interacting CarD/CdnL/TRCF family regulator